MFVHFLKKSNAYPLYRSGLCAGPLHKINKIYISIPKGIYSLQITNKISAGTEEWKEGRLHGRHCAKFFCTYDRIYFSK